jgi:hypothetical protein
MTEYARIDRKNGNNGLNGMLRTNSRYAEKLISISLINIELNITIQANFIIISPKSEVIVYCT